MEHESLTGTIIGVAIAVHRELGPGFVEGIYENALAIELRARDVRFERQRAVDVSYRGHSVSVHRLDLFVADELVVELKSVVSLVDAHYITVRSYLRAVGREHGLLLNFAKPTLEARARARACMAWVPGFLGSLPKNTAPGGDDE